MSGKPTIDVEQLKRWRLILGKTAQDSLGGMCADGGFELSAAQQEMDEALAAIYDETEGEGGGAQRSAAWGLPRRDWPSGWATFARISRRMS